MDYKFFCFDGKPKFVATKTKEFEIFMDMKWNNIDLRTMSLKKQFKKEQVHKPENFEKMIEVASKLSSEFQFVRVDLYNIDGKIYFGELTFTHASGRKAFRPLKRDIEIAKMIKI